MLNRRELLRMALRPQGPEGDALVVVFLRGGVDGLNLVVPLEDRAYLRARPTLRIREARAIDSRFGLHPALEPLRPLYAARRLAVVHAVGSDDDTRSHFEAQDQMEHGCRCGQQTGGGWLGRHLRARPGGAASALAAVAIGPSLPESLRGSPASVAMTSLEDVRLAVPDAARWTGRLEDLYAGEGAVEAAGRETIAMVRSVERLRAEAAASGDLGGYPDTEYGRGLRDAARLIRAEVGLEAASLDLGGWDTHFVQSGILEDHAAELAGGLASFARDLGERLSRVTVVVMTEFGRRVAENASLGTDHGRGSVMFVMGGGTVGGRVVAEWPGLEDLEGPGDLRVMTDYRDVLWEVLSKRCGARDAAAVFPEFEPRDRGVIG